MLAKHAEDYRLEYNTIRPHQAIAWNRPTQVHLGQADPTIPTFHTKKFCHLLDTEQIDPHRIRTHHDPDRQPGGLTPLSQMHAADPPINAGIDMSRRLGGSFATR